MNELMQVQVMDIQTEEEYTSTIHGVRESIADMWQDDEDMANEAYTTKSYSRLQEMMQGLGYLVHQIKD